MSVCSSAEHHACVCLCVSAVCVAMCDRFSNSFLSRKHVAKARKSRHDKGKTKILPFKFIENLPELARGEWVRERGGEREAKLKGEISFRCLWRRKTNFLSTQKRFFGVNLKPPRKQFLIPSLRPPPSFPSRARKARNIKVYEVEI